GAHIQTIAAQSPQNPHGHSNWVITLVYSLNGKQIASGSWDNTIKLWERSSSNNEDAYERAQQDAVRKKYQPILAEIVRKKMEKQLNND
ncbi:MAG: WD40 repeat domain-containing protein, partial [Candidatus Babeliales bacterium]|nr:WD40 repeat domain-containing protein [Candidatus Babeliales bacterium]